MSTSPCPPDHTYMGVSPRNGLPICSLNGASDVPPPSTADLIIGTGTDLAVAVPLAAGGALAIAVGLFGTNQLWNFVRRLV